MPASSSALLRGCGRPLNRAARGLESTGRAAQRRWATPAPKPGDGPLMSRRADRQLPDLSQVRFRWSRSLPVFLAIVTLSSLAIFNYQKSSSPIVASTLYALRVSPRARERLGDDIYFKHAIPWIRGQMNQVRGRVDISFSVRGTRGSATMRFASRRPSSRALFETSEWSLTMDDGGEWVDLLEGTGDPFGVLLADETQRLADDDDDDAVVADGALREAEAPTRGFRQQGASWGK